MELFNIQRFLDVYKDKLFSEDEKRQLLVDVIKDHTGVILKNDMISIKKNTMTITALPIIRNEIFMHKQQILASLKEKGRGDICEIN